VAPLGFHIPALQKWRLVLKSHGEIMVLAGGSRTPEFQSHTCVGCRRNVQPADHRGRDVSRQGTGGCKSQPGKFAQSCCASV